MVKNPPHPDAPLKVVCFLFDPNVGGPTVRASQISSELRKKGTEVEFALPGTTGTARGFLEAQNFQVHDLDIPKPVLPNKPGKFLRFVFGVPGSLVRLTRFLRNHRIDVVHINGAFDILPAIAAKLTSTPCVWQLNDMLFGTRLSRVLGRFVGSLADVVAVTSPPVISHYQVARYSPVVLPVPVDTERYTTKDLPDNGSVCFGAVGNWNPLKRIEDFIDIIAYLHDEGYAVTGKIFGKLLRSQKAYWEPLLAQIEDRNLRDVIRVEGFVQNVPEALQDLDILLITSQSEAGPMSCLDAMATGLPVITYPVGDVHKMLDPDGRDPAGIVVPIGDVTSMREVCGELITDRNLARTLGRNGRQRAKSHYDLANLAPLTDAAYRRAVNAE
jgi:glycosyltransferase involved in cell wall biosynthesis